MKIRILVELHPSNLDSIEINVKLIHSFNIAILIVFFLIFFKWFNLFNILSIEGLIYGELEFFILLM